MSEVKRFSAGDIFEGSKVVYAGDFDRVTAERDAALVDNGLLRENIAAQILERVFEYHALQQRLTAADELLDSAKAELVWQESDNAELRKRMGVLEGLLREIRQSCELSKDRDAQIDAALKPTEGGGDE